MNRFNNWTSRMAEKFVNSLLPRWMLTSRDQSSRDGRFSYTKTNTEASGDLYAEDNILFHDYRLPYDNTKYNIK